MGLISKVRNMARTILLGGDSAFGDESGGWSIVSGATPTTYQTSGRNVRILGFERHPIVNACVHVIVDMISPLEWQVYKERADGRAEVLTKHPLLDLLNGYGRELSPNRLRALTAIHYLLYGNSYWHLLRKGGRPPTGINLRHPEDIQFVYLDRESLSIVRYDFRHTFRFVAEIDELDYKDVVHFRDLSGGDWLFGFPRAASAIGEIATDDEATQYVRQVVTNHGQPGLLFFTNDSVPDGKLKSMQQNFEEKFVQRGGRGGIRFMRGLVAPFVKELGFNLQQLEFPELRAITREGICAAFNVDPRMVGATSAKGTSSGLNSNEYSEARRRLVKQTVLPILINLAGEINHWLAPEYGYVKARFNPDSISLLTQDDKELNDIVLAQLEKRMITLEEARPKLGYSPEMDPAGTLVSTKSADIKVSDRFKLIPENVRLTMTAAVKPPEDSGLEEATPPPAPVEKKLTEPPPTERTIIVPPPSVQVINQLPGKPETRARKVDKVDKDGKVIASYSLTEVEENGRRP